MKLMIAKLEIMADKAMAKGEYGKFKTLNREDVLAIYRAVTYKRNYG